MLKKLRKKFDSNLSTRILDEILIRYKNFYIKFGNGHSNEKKILFIFGCQRSGTTLMTKIFNRDLNSKVYEEHSILSSLDINRKRLDPPNMVREKLQENRASLFVLKPLVESQNCNSLLEEYPNSKGLWMFRNYNDVINSNIKKFGIKNGIKDIKPIVDNTKNNWRSEQVSEETKTIIRKFYNENMNPYDAAALFWVVRNRIFFEKNLDKNQRIKKCRYDDLVLNPSKVMKSIYQFLNLSYPGRTCTIGIHSNSIGKGKKIHLTPEVEKICQDLLVKFEN